MIILETKINKMVDYTNLKASLSLDDFDSFIKTAKSYKPYSVCINPFFVKRAKAHLKDTDIKICTVISFPLGSDTIESKIHQSILAVNNGADEIDYVMNQSTLDIVRIEAIEISKIIKKISSNVVIKTIIETSNLTIDNLVNVSKQLDKTNIDFIKTSTGTTESGANASDIRIIRNNSSKKIKASGGIKTYEKAKSMILAGASRIGTSSKI